MEVKKSLSKRKLFVLMALAFNVQYVVADETTGNELVLDTIRITAPGAQAVLGNDTITNDEIERRSPTTIRDVFAGESSITSSGGAAIATKVFVNGIEESMLSVTIDGARQNKSAFHHTGNVLFDPDLLKAVEITKGLAPADGGPGALGGSIAYETKDATDLLEAGDSFGGKISLTAGTNESFFRRVLSLYGAAENVDFVISGAKSSSDDYEDAGGNSIDGTEADLENVIGKLSLKSSSGDKLTFSASRTEDTGIRAAQAGPGGIYFIRADFEGVVGRDSEFVEGLSKRESYTLTYSRDDARGWFDPFFQITYNEQEVDVDGAYGKNESVSGTFKNNFDFDTGYVSAGLDFFKEKAKGEVRGAFASSGEEEHDNVGIFAQVRQDLNDRVSVSYGARWDTQDFEGADGSDFDDSGVSANGSVDVILTDTLTLNAGYASTWGGYELGEAAIMNFFTPWSYDGFTTSRAKSSRLGLRYEKGGFQTSAAIFKTDIEDFNAVLPSGGDRGEKIDIETEGFETSIAYLWSNSFVRLNYTYADVTQDEQTIGTTAYYYGRPVGNIFALEAAHQISTSWRIGATAEAALSNDLDSVTLDSYQIFNAYATYEPTVINNLTIRLDVKNLFDEQYSSRSSDGLGSSSVIALAEPGRDVRLSMSYKF